MIEGIRCSVSLSGCGNGRSKGLSIGEDHQRAHKSLDIDGLLLGLHYPYEPSLLLVLLTSYVTVLNPMFMCFLLNRPGYLMDLYF
ncbi:hypothetical protein NITLEN_50200 [Nitrospira lenta]|uniref:Uncharacterized protein n=1 Tax=Nitrospira lenta TaxID=1436998 RepID=A0A330L8Z8_9BACT|nr:hypothetical protein NITLEN_50200 [Nitrospira lenta]